MAISVNVNVPFFRGVVVNKLDGTIVDQAKKMRISYKDAIADAISLAPGDITRVAFCA